MIYLGNRPVGVMHDFPEELVEKDVNFYDYDGTLLYSYTKSEINRISSLPPNPSHVGLTAQGWNWTLAEIKDQIQHLPDLAVNVGQLYITSSGKTEIDFTLEDPNCLSPYLVISVNGTVVVDWGDGSATTTVTGSSLTGYNVNQHTYPSTGSYTLTIEVTNGAFAFYNHSSEFSGVFSVVSTGSNYIRRDPTYANTIKHIRLGNNVSVGVHGFCRIYNLETLTVPTGTTFGVRVFGYDEKLKYCVLPRSVTTVFEDLFARCSSILGVSLPSTINKFENGAFNACRFIKDLTIPYTATSFANNVVSSCISLRKYIVPTGKTTSSNYEFSSLYNLEKISLPNTITSLTVSYLQDCNKLESFVIPSSVTSIGSNCFLRDYRLKTLTLPNTVTTISDGAFQTCTSLESINLPSSITSIGKGIFNGCTSLKEITLPVNITEIPESMFAGCTNLRTVNFTSTITSFGKNAFNGCYALHSMPIPSGMTAIPDGLFRYCWSLQEVTIPVGVTTIGANAFEYDSAIKVFHCLPTTPPTIANANAFSQVGIGPIVFYVPQGSLQAYQTAPIWSNYASYLQEE